MLSSIEKNLSIASMESALQYVHAAAGISSLNDIETFVTLLRADFSANPDLVSDFAIKTGFELIENARIPSLGNLKRLYKAVRDAEAVPEYLTADGTALADGTIRADGKPVDIFSADGSAIADGSTFADGNI